MLPRSRLCPVLVRVLHYSSSSGAIFRDKWCERHSGFLLEQWNNNVKATKFTVAFPVRTYGKKKKAATVQSFSSDVVDMEALQTGMAKAVEGLKWECAHKVVSRMNPSVLEGLMVETSQSKQQQQQQQVPLKTLGQVSLSGGQNMIVNLAAQPQAVSSVVKAIQEADLGLNPLVEGSAIRVPIPKASKEMREKMVKLAKSHSEKAKVSIRKVLQRGVNEARKMKGQVSEDDIRRTEKQIQEMTNQHVKTVDTILQSKTKELLGS